MNRKILAVIVGAFAASWLPTGALAQSCPTFHTLTNGTTADASQVMDNFNYILGCPNFTGNVGIGVSTPSVPLTVRNTDT